jgi:uncharacterized protein (DUF1778 family)
MVGKRKRFTLDLETEMQRRLKVVAALKGISMRQYCLAAIEKELAKEEVESRRTATFNDESFDRLVSLRAEIFRGRKLPGDSTELIREAREIRDKEIDEWLGGDRCEPGR